MSNLKEKSKINTLKVISILNIIVLLAFTMSDVAYKYFFINITVLIVLDYIIIPFNKEKEKNTVNKNVIRKTILKSLVSLILLISFYRILVGRNYNLKYTYYIALSCVFIIWFSLYYKNIADSYKADRREGKRVLNIKFIFDLIFNTLVGLIFPYILLSSFFIPSDSMLLTKIVEPNTISMEKITKDYYKNIEEGLFDNNELDIDSSEAIEGIVEDIEGEKIENIIGTDLMNYQRMTEDYKDQYLLQFIYGETESGQLEDGYITFIRLLSNGEAFIEEINFKSFSIFNTGNDFSYYPIQLSKETRDTIFSFKE